MFLWNFKTCKLVVKQMFFERLQVEGVNGKRCQGNIELVAPNHAQTNENTMLNLCLTNDAKHIGKGYKVEAERAPTNYEKYATTH